MCDDNGEVVSCCEMCFMTLRLAYGCCCCRKILGRFFKFFEGLKIIFKALKKREKFNEIEHVR